MAEEEFQKYRKNFVSPEQNMIASLLDIQQQFSSHEEFETDAQCTVPHYNDQTGDTDLTLCLIVLFDPSDFLLASQVCRWRLKTCPLVWTTLTTKARSIGTGACPWTKCRARSMSCQKSMPKDICMRRDSLHGKSSQLPFRHTALKSHYLTSGRCELARSVFQLSYGHAT